MIQQRIHAKFYGLLVSAALVGCGADDSQIVQKFVYDVGDNDIEVGVEFNQSVEMNTDLIVPIKEYGEISLLAGNGEQGFRITAGLNLDALVDPDLMQVERTRLLPNGQPMSSYVMTDVARARFQPHKKIATSLYLGLEEEYMYVGVALELSFIDENFPAGLVISQRIRDSQNRMLGVVSVFGPKVEDGELVAPGGLFFITNVSDLIGYGEDAQSLSMLSHHADQSLVPDASAFISEPHRDTYSEAKNIRKLMKLYRRQGREAGLID